MISILGSWTQEALCKGMTHIFFPAKDSERPQARMRREQKAKLVCSKCPVLVSCRDYARQNPQFGIWGGETEEERLLRGYGYPPYGNTLRRRVSRRVLNNAK